MIHEPAVSHSVSMQPYLDKARQEIDACVALEDALRRVLAISIEALGAVRGAIVLKNLETGDFEIKAKQDPNLNRATEKTFSFRLGEGIAGWVAHTGQPYCWNGDISDPHFAASPSGRSIDSLLAAPIKAHGAVTGVICVEGPQRDFFTETQEELFTRLAGQAAIVIERSRFLEALIELGQAVTEAPLAAMLQRVARQISVLLNQSVCVIDLQDGKGGELHVPALAEGIHQLPEALPRLAAPLLSAQGDRLGAVHVYSPNEFSPWQCSLFNAFVRHAGVAIENARLLEKYHNYAGILEKLRQMSGEVIEALQRRDEGAVLQVIAAYASQVLGTDVLTIYPYLVEENHFETPPIWTGDIKHPEYMKRKIYPDDIPVRILKEEKKHHYWSNTAETNFLTGKIMPRDAEDPERDRFAQREGIISSAAAKLTVGDKPVGVAFFNFRQPQPFDPEQCRVIEAFANYTALALETLASYRRIRESASKDEAERWNRELHDSVVQVLAGGVLAKAGTIKNQLRRGDTVKAEANLDKLEKAAQYVFDEVQDIRAGLSSRRLAQQGLICGLQEYIDFMGKGQALAIALEHDELGPLSQEIEHNLYRITQEALSNVVKSAQATHAKVSLSRDGDRITLIVEDDGRGFDVAAILPGSYGLIGMATRARMLGGEFAIVSRPAVAGTRVAAVIPVGRKG